MRHVITHDAPPYPALALEISGFSYGLIRERRSLIPLRRRHDRNPSPTIFGRAKTLSRHHLIRNCRPQPDAPRVIQRLSRPSNGNMIPQSAPPWQLSSTARCRVVDASFASIPLSARREVPSSSSPHPAILSSIVSVGEPFAASASIHFDIRSPQPNLTTYSTCSSRSFSEQAPCQSENLTKGGVL